MKVKLSRDQVILLGVAVLLVFLAGGLGWFGLGGLMTELEHAQSLAERRGSGDLSVILGRPGGISQARQDVQEVTKISQDLEKTEDKMIGPWRKGLEEASGVGTDWSKDPGKWKDKLVNDNDEILKKCGRLGNPGAVTLGENFYLGFEEFKQKSPSPEQVPALARQLSVAKKLVDILIQAKKTPEGYATSCFIMALEVPISGENASSEPAKIGKGNEDKNADILRERYHLRLSCSPEVLYEYVRLLCQDPWLFIITNLSLANEKEAFPKRGEIAKLFQSEATASGEAPDPEKVRGNGKESINTKLLLVLSGKERVDVAMDVDYVGWKVAPTAVKAPEAKK